MPPSYNRGTLAEWAECPRRLLGESQKASPLTPRGIMFPESCLGTCFPPTPREIMFPASLRQYGSPPFSRCSPRGSWEHLNRPRRDPLGSPNRPFQTHRQIMFPERLPGTLLSLGPPRKHVPRTPSGNMVSLLSQEAPQEGTGTRIFLLTLRYSPSSSSSSSGTRFRGNKISRGVGGNHVPGKLFGNMIPRGFLGSCFGASSDLFRASWGPLGGLLGPLGALLGPLGAFLKASWSYLGRLKTQSREVAKICKNM